jgi:hypothetical protein
MTVQTYLIHLRDRQLALAVGAELEDRLARAGRDAVALVPAGDGLGLTRAAGQHRASRGSYAGAPHVVALYEDGLLETLESLGLTAYVGVCPGEEPGTVRWGDGGAILLPVATARELVDAVAEHSPWAAHAARLSGQPSHARSRKLAVAGIAGVAGPLLLAGLPATAAAASPAPAGHHPLAGTTVAATDTRVLNAMTVPPTSPVRTTRPFNARAFLIEIENALRFYLQQARQANAGNTQNVQALENQVTRLLNTLASQPRQATQPAPAQPTQPGAGQQGGGQQGGGAPTNAGTQQQPGGGQGQQGQGHQGQGQDGQGQDGQQQGTSQGQQDPSSSQNGSTSQGSTSQGSMSQGGTSGQGGMSSGGGMTGSGLGSSSSGGGSSASGGPSSGGGSSGGYSGGGSSGGGSA